jgi:DNA-binding sugar fermentation-stimulating protein
METAMNTDDDFFKKLDDHPRLKKRFNEILQIAENTSGELITADEAETKAIEEIQKLGQEIMQEWAENQHRKQIKTFEKENKTRRHVKKNSTGKRNLEK